MTYAWLLVFFIVGAGGASMIWLWAMGSTGRTFMWANIVGKRVAEIPRDDRTIDYVRPAGIDSKGRWHVKDKGEREVYTVNPNHVNITSGKTKVVTLLDNFGITTHAEEAKLAEHAGKEEGESDPGSKEVTVLKHGQHQSISWAAIKERGSEIVGPVNLAGIMGSVFKAHNPLPKQGGMGMSSNQKIAIGVIIVIGLAAFIGIYIANAQGWI